MAWRSILWLTWKVRHVLLRDFGPPNTPEQRKCSSVDIFRASTVKIYVGER